MGNSLLCHYIDNCFKKGIILWGQKHCDWGAKLRNGGHLPPPVPMLKKALNTIRFQREHQKRRHLIWLQLQQLQGFLKRKSSHI